MSSLTSTLKPLLERRSLSTEQMRDAFRAMMAGEVGHGEIGALLALLATRVPTSAELLGAAQVMRENVSRLQTRTDPEDIVDTCGTGGAPKTFNVSTLAGIVAAASGAHVAKHGNRSRTGRGSAELLEALGVNLEAPLEVQARCLDEVGITFCFAVRHHPAMKHVAPVRQSLGFPTIFNLLGPLTNPAGARRQVLGVYEPRFLEPVAQTLSELGTRKSLVVHSDDGLDELSISAGTELMQVTPDGITRLRVVPEELGLERAPREAVMAEDLAHAVRIARAILAGEERGAPRDAVVLASAAALFVADRVSSLEQGVRTALEALESGRAQATLDAWISASRG
ncbi:MAG: anthranilate phosphoribosyltransferase [Polyangiales bacterium]